jgi:ribosomal protein S18 acetylase RimI-like enzyme
MTRMLLEVRPSNESAIAFYRQAGFSEIGRRRGYYPASAGREDAIVMAREL